MPEIRLECGQQGCNFGAKTWDVSRNGQTTQVNRCDTHAASLRALGYEVRLPQKKKWDLTSTNSMEAAAGYLRKNADAVLVLVVRAGDAAIAVDQGIEARDVPAILQRTLHEALERLELKEEEKRKKAVHQQIQRGTNPEERRYA